MGDGDDEANRTLWVGNLHEKVTDEILFELFLQVSISIAFTGVIFYLVSSQVERNITNTDMIVSF